MKTFEELNLNDQLLKAIKRLGFTEPTEIQEKSIPYVLEGKDVVGESSTGSGKTLAFGCGIIGKVEAGHGTQALVLTPTRELAEQVKDELIKFSHEKPLSIITIYGGVAMGPQIDALPTADVIVATPGRLLDHMERGNIDLSHIKLLALDEVDRMLDMGFIDDVEKILKQCSEDHQTLFFSATIMPRIKKLVSKFLKDPIEIRAGKQVDPSKLKQVYYDVSKGMKFALLVHLLKNEKSDLVMVFCNTRRNTDFVVKNLKLNGVKAVAIHGGLTQNKRSNTLSNFNDGKTEVLVCTDVAARGLHIDNVSHVYNYDLPNNPEDYIHRIGRTARAGEEGKVINTLCELDFDNFSRILNDYRDMKVDKVDSPKTERVKIDATVSKPEGRGRFPRGRSNNNNRRRW